MSVNCSPFGPKPQFELSSGVPAIGGQLFFYAAGSVNTKQTTYTDSTGSVANTNPIILNSLGNPTNTEIWFTSGLAYKVVYAPVGDTDPPSSPIWTIDNLRGINDTTVSISEWIAGPTPTYIGATSFSLVGDQTSTFMIGRRVKTTNSGGTVYGTITNSAYTTLTTVTVVNDSGVIDSGLSAVSYGLLSATNQSIPTVNNATNAINLAGGVAGAVPYQSAPGTTAFSAAGAAGQPILSGGTGAPTFGSLQSIVSMPDPTLAANAMTLPASTHALDFRSETLTTGAVTTISGTAAALVIPSGAKLGTTNGVLSSIVEVIMNNAGTLEKAVINLAGGNDLSETGVISTTAISAAATSANVFYSNAARSNLAYRVVRRIDSTQATAGTWVTSPSLVQGVGGQALASMSSLGYGQTVQDVTGSRTAGTTYYNTTGKPFYASLVVTNSAASTPAANSYLSVNGTPTAWAIAENAGGQYAALTCLIPVGASYVMSSTISTVVKWIEIK